MGISALHGVPCAPISAKVKYKSDVCARELVQKRYNKSYLYFITLLLGCQGFCEVLTSFLRRAQSPVVVSRAAPESS